MTTSDFHDQHQKIACSHKVDPSADSQDTTELERELDLSELTGFA